eukprot:jgi/Undpi1/8285/HiC_scaffold_25.g10754.m1
MKTFCSIITTLLAATFLGVARGQTEEECSVSALSAAAAEQMDMFGKGLYLEPACVDGTQPLPMHCNYMGIGQECRGCFMTCDGATSYIENFADEIAVWGEDAVITFCPDAEVDSLDEC